LTERYRDAMPDSRLVACAGCYPTAAILALQPLVTAGLVEGPIIIDAKSGVSGAGKTPTERTHFSECHGSLSAYGVFAHRHAVEIEQELGVPVTFVPHLVPIDRGIFETKVGRRTSVPRSRPHTPRRLSSGSLARICPRSSTSRIPTSATSAGA
jgi:N-acetyl-gamma-glutamyl-phosphate reductase